jgi:molecular chaperone DnaK
MPIGFAMPGGRFRKVIDKNTQIPVQRAFRLPPPRNGQPLELDIFQGDGDRIVDNEYLGTLKFPPEASGLRVSFNLDEECLLHVTLEGAPGEAAREVLLATQDTPSALKQAWQEEAERRRLLAEQSPAEEAPRGLFASIRKVFGGQ